MIIRSFFIPGIAHRSYLLGGTETCIIIDPARDTGRYIAAAKEERLKITGILQTHLHADFISGHMDLHQKTGARIYAPASAGCTFPHTPVHEGTEIDLDDITIRVMETPGHTPEHVAYIVVHHSRSEDPVLVFTGDTLFVGDVGRPDLFPGRSRELAGALYESLHRRLLELPDYCEVYPAHGAGSFCGRALSSKESSTIGYERRNNPVLQINDKEEFIDSLTTHMPAAPDHFSRCSEINRLGPALLNEIPDPKPFSPHEVKEKINYQKAILLDLREYGAFSSLHIPGSFNLDSKNNLSTFGGWVIPPEKEVILVGHDMPQIHESALELQRVGLDTITGYLGGGMERWVLAGYPIGHINVISVYDLAQMRKEKKELQIIDVRTPEEFDGYHLPNVLHIPWYEIRNRYPELDKNQKTIIMCGTGTRSGIAASFLMEKGFSGLFNIAGGYTAWIAAGLNK